MRALIVGAGLMGRHHAQAAIRAGGSISAIVDPDGRRAAALAELCHGASFATSLQEALEKHRAEVVHICSPADTHAELGQLAAEARCHALIEKPAAANASDTRRLLEGFARSGRLACPVHQYALQRSVRAAATIVSKLGLLRQIAVDVCSAGGEKEAVDLDCLAADILSHPLSMIQKLAPRAPIARLKWSCLRASAGEWLITAPFETASLCITVSLNGRPTRFRTRIVSDRGSLELDNFHDYFVQLPGNVSRARKIALPFVQNIKGLTAAGVNLLGRAVRNEHGYPGLRTLVADFYAAASASPTGAPPITPDEAIAVAEARDQIMRLARSA